MIHHYFSFVELLHTQIIELVRSDERWWYGKYKTPDYKWMMTRGI